MRPSRRLPLIAVAAGLLVGLATATALVVVWLGEEEPEQGPDAAEAFVDAWDRSKRSTYYLVGKFHRETANGGELTSAVVVAQRSPGDSIRRQFGGVDGWLDGERVRCTTDNTDAPTCSTAKSDSTPDDEILAEIANWDDHVGGRAPLYRVEDEGDGCYSLHLTREFLVPPYGNESRFCFDEATGAPTLTEIHKDEGTDTVTATEIRATVTDEDLRLPS